MSALLAIPEPGQLQLTEHELEGITGTPMTKLQLEWLQSNGWAHTTTRAGRPVVGRLYANLKLSGVDVATIAKVDQTWSPNVHAIQ